MLAIPHRRNPWKHQNEENEIMRILIISPSYSEGKKSAYAFVHAHAKIYQKFGNKVKVFVPSKDTYTYKFEGINVYKGTNKTYTPLLKEFDPDIVTIHSPRYTMNKNPLKMLNETSEQAPIIMWIHGIEALINAFHHYFPPWQVKGKIKNILGGTIKITILRFLIPKASAVVYVSKWMKNMAERYFLFKHPYSFIIPNPIDTSLFTYTRKGIQKRKKGISVRGLEWKYGMDIAIKAYSNLRETSLTILGSGPLETYMYNLAKKSQSNVSFLNTHIEHNKMPELYANYGYFVAPSRTEAQGVAMCEAMACGLPVIATNVGGIPEFVRNGINGILVPPENPKALRKAVKQLLAHEQLYNMISENGAKYAKKTLAHKEIYRKEYSVFKMCQERFNFRP
jgi:glycosyltransferase involved in cell wall biosynthesis